MRSLSEVLSLYLPHYNSRLEFGCYATPYINIRSFLHGYTVTRLISTMLDNMNKDKQVSYAVENYDEGEHESISISPEPQLVKRFSLWSTVALQVSLICSPIALGTFLSTVIGVGGSPVLIYGFILAVTCDLIICYSMAELASAYPHSSAQIHWVYCLSPVKYRNLLSFITGLLSCAGWIFAIFTTALTDAMLIISLALYFNPDFVVENWHYYLIFSAVIVVAFCVNAFGVSILPKLNYVSAAVINCGTLFILITLLVRTKDKQSTTFVWKEILNETGWASNGLVFFLGLLPSIACVSMFDGAAHQTDEIPQPNKNIPLVMIIANSFSAIFAFISGIIYMYCVANINNLTDPVGGQPIVQLMVDSFQSDALVTIGVIFLILTFFLSEIGYVCSTSRLFWAFANSNGVPFGKTFFGKVNTKLQVPLNALMLVAGITLVLGLMIFGSNIALTAVLGSCMVCVNLSYIFPVAMLLIKSRFSVNPHKRFPLEEGNDKGYSPIEFAANKNLPYFNLGNLGLPLNIIAVVWACFIMVWLNFPLYDPVATNNMNYACAVLGITFIIAGIIWFTYARKHYQHDITLKHHI